MSWIEWTDDSFRGLDLTELKVDEAFLNISNSNNKQYYLYSLSEECVRCAFKKVKKVAMYNDTIVKLNTARGIELRLFSEDYGPYVSSSVIADYLVWSEKAKLGEFGVYDLVIKSSGATQFLTAKEPVSTFPSLIIATIIAICAFWIIKYVNLYYFSRAAGTRATVPQAPDSPGNENEDEEPKVKKRLKSLDIFRGIAIVLMIFVNYGGGHYWWIEHAVWNGLHFADLVFPWFLFIMGVCIPLSIKGQINRQVARTIIVKKIIKRSITLFLLGLCLNTLRGASFQNIRIMGVLERFGIAYLVVSLLYLAFVNNTINAETGTHQLFFEIRIIWKQWLVILAFIVVHLVVMFGIEAPYCDVGYFGPGGIHENLAHSSCTGGIVGYIDRTVLGVSHMYHGAKIRAVYDAMVFDPEGLFGCILTCVQVFLGVQCGVTMMLYPTARERLRRWIVWGVSLLVVTAALTSLSVNDGLIPINKNLWSLSYVTVTAGLAFLLLSIVYFLVDVRDIGGDFWTIFMYPGMNAIVLYVGHSVFHSMWPFHWSIDNMNTHFLLLLENLYAVTIWILISHYMYHKQIFYHI